MNEYVIMTMVVSFFAVFSSVFILWLFGRGLAATLYLIITFVSLVQASMFFYLGKEGFTLGRVLVLAPLSGVFMMGFVLYIRHFIVVPMVSLTKHMQQTAIDKDLTVEMVSVHRRDEIGIMQEAYARRTRDLGELVRALREGINRMAANTAQLSSAVAQAVATSAEQVAAASQVSAASAELSQSSMATATSAHHVVDVAEAALETDQKVSRSVVDAMTKMEAIGSYITEVAKKIGALDARSSQISEIVEAVNEFAVQSNLLSLNANIEAAKAGDHGRGFSVVASQVRSLAEQSREATARIQSIIREIKAASLESVRSTEVGRQKAGEGRAAVAVVSEFMGELSKVLQESSAQARGIFMASSQQAAGISQISEAIERVRRGGEEMALSSQMTAAAVTELKQLGAQLSQLVEQYQT